MSQQANVRRGRTLLHLYGTEYSATPFGIGSWAPRTCQLDARFSYAASEWEHRNGSTNKSNRFIPKFFHVHTARRSVLAGWLPRRRLLNGGNPYCTLHTVVDVAPRAPSTTLPKLMLHVHICARCNGCPSYVSRKME